MSGSEGSGDGNPARGVPPAPGATAPDSEATPAAGASFSDKKTERAWRDPLVEGPAETPVDARRTPPPPPPEDSGFSFSNQPTAEWRRPADEPAPSEAAARETDAALGVADVDPTPADRRPTGILNPWQSTTPGMGVEAQAAMEMLAEAQRRDTAGFTPQPRPTRRWLIIGLGAGAVIIAGFAAGTLFRAQERPAPIATAAEPVLEDPAEPEPQPLVPSAAAESPDAGEATDSADGNASSAAAVEVPAGEEGRKALRQLLFDAFAAERYGEAVALAQRLESDFRIDWEAEFVRADAVRLSGDTRAALQRYRDFAKKYPTNAKADDAHFWAGEILRLTGDLKGARRHFEVVARNPRSNLRATAKRRLRGLR